MTIKIRSPYDQSFIEKLATLNKNDIHKALDTAYNLFKTNPNGFLHTEELKYWKKTAVLITNKILSYHTSIFTSSHSHNFVL